MAVIVDLTTAKQWLQISHTAQDTVIQALMDAAESYVANWLNVSFTQLTNYSENLDGGGAYLLPTQRPVTSLVIQNGYTFPTVKDLLSGDQLNAILIGDGRIVKADDQGLPLLKPDFYNWDWQNSFPYWARWIDGVARYQVTYNGGYNSNWPPAFKTAILLLIGRWYQQRGAELSNGAASASVDFGSLMGGDIQELLKPFSRRRMVRV